MPQAVGKTAEGSGEWLFGWQPSISFKMVAEALIWIVGLAGVGLADPTAPSVIDLCVFKAIGLPGCPGCGLGHAIGYLFRAEWHLAIQSHWFSPVVLLVLVSRIGSLLRTAYFLRSHS